jgi:hypothetical protein
MSYAASLIEKEQIANFKFPKHEVLHSKDEIIQRRRDVERAMVLGNTEHGKMRITFETTEGIKAVETTVWAASDTEISLKGGVSIPMNAILKLSI